MRFLVETNDQLGKIFEIDTAHDESSPQAIRAALAKVDPKVQEYHTIVTGSMGRNRIVLCTKSTKGQHRLEIYLRRSGLIG